jgi:hypothetical protein
LRSLRMMGTSLRDVSMSKVIAAEERDRRRVAEANAVRISDTNPDLPAQISQLWGPLETRRQVTLSA